ncbi:thiol-disulfide oxidoreductase DCC family protein [Faecalibacter bovis]|uniref:DUF393 domain-containing protein n=1 Tax=Faecalibacter bovis TaxID=2898187 RepID=A0ABX7XCC5_9FLAO|nr:DCC1-like thiol-disulfide oxidoreductase family protein [Faecalibacter bovis]QTV05564.1 DUF393 domain-containing protein [Faecalibacter bovis]
MKNDVVIYDGDCGFCSFWVQWLLNKDKNNILKFASLQGSYGQEFLKKNNLNTTDFDTIYYHKEEGIFYDKSNAILEILSSLGGLYSLMKVFKIIPRFIRDEVYMLVSKNRKKFAQNNCLLPSPSQRSQFLD